MAQEEETRARSHDEDEAFALALAREYELADAEMDMAFAASVSGEDFGDLSFAAGAAGVAGGLEQLLRALQGRAPPPEDTAPPAPTKADLARLPTRRATGKLLEEECPVCFGVYSEGEELRTLPCMHVFHTECIDKWLTSRRSCSGNCPVCHTEVGI